MALGLLHVLGERRRELRVARDLLRTLDLDKRLQLDRVRVRQVDRELLFDGRGHTGPPVFKWWLCSVGAAISSDYRAVADPKPSPLTQEGDRARPDRLC